MPASVPQLVQADVDALQAILDRYREQTFAVGGAPSIKHFEAAPHVMRAEEALRRVRAAVARVSKP